MSISTASPGITSRNTLKPSVSTATLSEATRYSCAFGRLVAADDQRPDAVGVAESQQAVTGDHRHHGIGATAAPVHAGHRLENGFRVELVPGRRRLQLMRQDIEQHLGIGIGVDVAQILQKHVALQLLGVGEVAVMRQHDAEGRIDVKRLRLGGIVGGAGRRVTAMADPPIALQIAHVAGAKHIAHQTRALVHMEAPAVGRRDTRGVLTAVL